MQRLCTAAEASPLSRYSGKVQTPPTTASVSLSATVIAAAQRAPHALRTPTARQNPWRSRCERSTYAASSPEKSNPVPQQRENSPASSLADETGSAAESSGMAFPEKRITAPELRMRSGGRAPSGANTLRIPSDCTKSANSSRCSADRLPQQTVPSLSILETAAQIFPLSHCVQNAANEAIG